MSSSIKTNPSHSLQSELFLTNNFHVDICSVLPCRVSHHNRVDALVLPLSALDGEDTVALGGVNMDPAVSLCDDLQDPEQSYWVVPEQRIYWWLSIHSLDPVMVAQ